MGLLGPTDKSTALLWTSSRWNLPRPLRWNLGGLSARASEIALMPRAEPAESRKDGCKLSPLWSPWPYGHKRRQSTPMDLAGVCHHVPHCTSSKSYPAAPSACISQRWPLYSNRQYLDLWKGDRRKMNLMGYNVRTLRRDRELRTQLTSYNIPVLYPRAYDHYIKSRCKID